MVIYPGSRQQNIGLDIAFIVVHARVSDSVGMLNSIPAFLYPNTYSENTVPQLFESKDVVEFKELLLANTIQIDAMYQLLIQKGYLTEAEFLEKMKQV